VEIFSGKFFAQQNFERSEKILSSAEFVTVARMVQIHVTCFLVSGWYFPAQL